MKPILLCILDGWGHRSLDANNGLTVATEWQRLLKTYPYTLLDASESFVGLPDGQMGNSEVGHMTIGLGRVLMQDLPRINQSVESGAFKELPAFKALIEKTKAGSGRCHVMGLFSDGGVHSHADHFFYSVKALATAGIEVIVHPIMDGRDTPPKAGAELLEQLDSLVDEAIRPGTIGGRFFAMDRDKRWDRIQKAYDVLTQGAKSATFSSFSEALQYSYAAGITDEFMIPMALQGYDGIKKGDSFLMINFRADRARQFLTALVDPTFDEFQMSHPALSCVTGMTPYSDALAPYMETLFPKVPLNDGLGDILSKHGLRQLRVAETEKYAHVTYFFNGGIETPFAGEDRIMIPSPKVATYDLAPEMSAREVTDVILMAIQKKEYQLIVANYANPDMVGHTGVVPAIQKAVQTVDGILAQLEEAAHTNDWTLIITADHGNVETMAELDGAAHTAHTCNKVPFLVINGEKGLPDSRTLADIAPTILTWLGLPVPHVMMD